MKFKVREKILKILSLFAAACILLTLTVNAETPDERGKEPNEKERDFFQLDCKSAILVEANTQTVLYSKNAD